jgi:hypothetical protein
MTGGVRLNNLVSEERSLGTSIALEGGKISCSESQNLDLDPDLELFYQRPQGEIILKVHFSCWKVKI